MYDRRGSLFNRPFKSKEIDNDAYLTAVITYIHRNPVHHGFCDSIEEWPFSSYQTYFLNKETKLKRDEVINWFGGKQQIQQSHRLEASIPDTSLFIDF